MRMKQTRQQRTGANSSANFFRNLEGMPLGREDLFVSEEQSTQWSFQAEIMMDSTELGKGKMGDSGASVEKCVFVCMQQLHEMCLKFL